ncbi:MAG TPA: DUF3857 domain-containing protein [Bacteroidales bacterium]|nr:DUF3857 domain-containing protein [Bacteroidales bacterium]
MKHRRIILFAIINLMIIAGYSQSTKYSNSVTTDVTICETKIDITFGWYTKTPWLNSNSFTGPKSAVGIRKYYVSTDYYKEIKINSANGLSESLIKIPYFKNRQGSRDEISNINIWVQKNNKKQKIKINNKLLKDEPLNDSINQLTYKIDNINAGDVVIYSFNQRSALYAGIPSIYFQSKYPTLKFNLKVAVPTDNFDVNFIPIGSDDLNYEKSEETIQIREFDENMKSRYYSLKCDVVAVELSNLEPILCPKEGIGIKMEVDKVHY